MIIPQMKTGPLPVRNSLGFLPVLGYSAIWLIIGGFAGRYLYPETVEKEVVKTVEKVVTQRVEVPVEKSSLGM